MDNTEKIRRIILDAGFSAEGIVPTENLVFSEDVRKLCEQNRCRKYGTTWACPPAVGTLEECRERVLDFRYMHLFSKIYTLESSLDFRGMAEGMKDFKDSTWELGRLLKGEVSPVRVLSNESCNRCKKCTYPSEPCRFPDELQHSIEGYGFNINELAKQAGLLYNNGAGTMTFFGAVLHS